MKTIISVVITLVLLSAAALALAASLPKTINYQGFLKSAG